MYFTKIKWMVEDMDEKQWRNKQDEKILEFLKRKKEKDDKKYRLSD